MTTAQTHTETKGGRAPASRRSARPRALSRNGARKSTTPELEVQGFMGFMRYLEHGYPSPQIRWHFHEAYELHFIVATSGKVFVGDFIGNFQPGQVVLTGPRLPHNWISNQDSQATKLRDMAVQFSHEPLEIAAQNIPELQELRPLLARAAYGVEFFNISGEVAAGLERIRDSSGLMRFHMFLSLMSKLAQCADYRLLSGVRIQSYDNDAVMERINLILNYISENYRQPLSAHALADKFGMSLTKFSRFFHRCTGNNFTDALNRTRISKACQLLMNSDRLISSICYDAGFNNVANFNRRFQQFKGVTPKEFRQNARHRFGTG